MATSDRTVHARLADGTEIVRYDRSGKWYAESPNSFRVDRKRIGIRDAVRTAVAGERDGGEIFLDRPGGGAFDAKVRAARG